MADKPMTDEEWDDLMEEAFRAGQRNRFLAKAEQDHDALRARIAELETECAGMELMLSEGADKIRNDEARIAELEQERAKRKERTDD